MLMNVVSEQQQILCIAGALFLCPSELSTAYYAKHSLVAAAQPATVLNCHHTDATKG